MQRPHLHSDRGQDSDCARLSSRAAAAAAGLLLRPRSCRPPHRGCCESRPDSMFGGSISMEMPPGPSPSAAAKIDLLRGRAAPHPETVQEERLSWTSNIERGIQPTNPAPASPETFLAKNVTTPILRLLRQSEINSQSLEDAKYLRLFVHSFVRPSVGKKNLDQLYSFINHHRTTANLSDHIFLKADVTHHSLHNVNIGQ